MKTFVKNIFFNYNYDTLSEIETKINEAINIVEKQGFYLIDIKIQNLSKSTSVFLLIFKNNKEEK